MDLNDLVGVTTDLATVATFLGIPSAIVVLIHDRRPGWPRSSFRPK